MTSATQSSGAGECLQDHHLTDNGEPRARMAHPIKNFLIMEVAKPNVGEKKPGSVRVDVTLDLSNVRPHLMREWEGLRKHDVGLLLTIVAPKQQTGVVDVELPFAQKVRASTPAVGTFVRFDESILPDLL